MALSNMVAEMRGAVPGYSSLLARTHINEAWKAIRNMKGWSFQLYVGAFATPGKVSAGAVTVTLGQTDVIGNAAATAAWLTASTPVSLLSQRQFRIGAGAIYNIIAYDDASDSSNSPNYPFATLTLDRPFIDLITNTSPVSPVANNGYTIYQCYYPTPIADFEAWENVCDVTNVIWLKCNATRHDRERIDRNDPQRQIFSPPGTLLPYTTDLRPGSSTLGYMMYELYPQPQAQYVYQTWCTRSSPDLVNPSDTLPYPMTESCVKALARVKAYEWAEANRDPNNPRGAGSDYRFLMGSAKAMHLEELKEIRSLDRDRVDMWNSRMTRLTGYGPMATFDPATGAVMSRNL
jgi:hypothetical protein